MLTHPSLSKSNHRGIHPRNMQVGAIKEVFYPEWLANIVVVKKKNGKWRVCVDFTDLNKAYPRDPFPIPWIDQLVDATVGYPWMSFLDTFQGYHQIPLVLDDQEKTAFVTPIGNYHYKVMPFGLKNARSTYQRMMMRTFEPQLGKSIEVYIDDMVLKSRWCLSMWETSETSLKLWGNTSCAQMLLSVRLVWD